MSEVYDIDKIGEDVPLLEGIRTTRAIRRLRPDPVPSELVRKVCEAGTFAPSGGNRQPWKFIAVTEASERGGPRRIRLDARGLVVGLARLHRLAQLLECIAAQPQCDRAARIVGLERARHPDQPRRRGLELPQALSSVASWVKKKDAAGRRTTSFSGATLSAQSIMIE